jgi:prophage maintenance system killer protein
VAVLFLELNGCRFDATEADEAERTTAHMLGGRTDVLFVIVDDSQRHPTDRC